MLYTWLFNALRLNLSTIYYGLFTYVDSCASSMASGSETAGSTAGSTADNALIQK